MNFDRLIVYMICVCGRGKTGLTPRRNRSPGWKPTTEFARFFRQVVVFVDV
jgi:hypothetical protein